MKPSPKIRLPPLNSPAVPNSWPAICSILFASAQKAEPGHVPRLRFLVEIQSDLTLGDEPDFRHRQVSVHLVLAALVYHYFVGCPRPTRVELDRFVDALVLLLDALVVSHHIESEPVPFHIGLLQGEPDVTHLLQSAGPRQRELVVVLLAELSQGA